MTVYGEGAVHVEDCLHCENRDGIVHDEPCSYFDPCGACCEDGMGTVPGADPDEGHLLLRSMAGGSPYFS